MNKKILLALPMCTLLAACAAPMTKGCKTIKLDNDCTSSNQVVNINVASGLTVAPPNACAKRDKDLEFRITPPNTSTIVATIPKNPADTWLVGVNSPDSGKIEIHIPNTVTVGSDHDYFIVTTNGYCYDPRIHIDPDS